ncbi:MULTISPECIES: hypothetical protein [unclassified Lactococcus]|uniref:hypothetical protein n=1 Tax=unclassified Lactococcus TaxID=2643510 RepID=UPI0011C87548|nr:MULTISPECIES: hypothetical protein [unclassified Lactococcus]MQW24063.1 hypothetical protein [Lactococcus sp. dk101]TXK36494.1 hypothetical protein FVP42_11185 [Lactococcus sp. dk310]TXK47171.1 hypothetical protein FVP43_10455 [Lactococcus sp. dk322]
MEAAPELEVLLLNKIVPPINELFDLLKAELLIVEDDFKTYLLEQIRIHENSVPRPNDFFLLSTTLLFYISVYNDEGSTLAKTNAILKKLSDRPSIRTKKFRKIRRIFIYTWLSY